MDQTFTFFDLQEVYSLIEGRREVINDTKRLSTQELGESYHIALHNVASSSLRLALYIAAAASVPRYTRSTPQFKYYALIILQAYADN